VNYKEQIDCLGEYPEQSNKLAEMMGWRKYNNGGFTHLQPYDASTIGVAQFFKICDKYKTDKTERLKDNFFKNQAKTDKKLRKTMLDEIVETYYKGE